MWIAAACQPYCGSYCELCVFLTLCQICSYGCTMGTIDTMKFENLNFNGWNLFWLGLDKIEAKMLDLCRFMQWSWKESKWSWKNHICPYFDCITCIFNKNRSNGLERNQDPLLLPCDSHIGAKMAVFAGDWPNWLPMVGHTLAKTHVYKAKYTSLRTYWLTDLSCVCPRSSAWSLTLLSLDLDQLYAWRSYLAAPTLLGNDTTVNTGRSLAFLFSFSLTGLIPSSTMGGASSALPPCLIYK